MKRGQGGGLQRGQGERDGRHRHGQRERARVQAQVRSALLPPTLRRIRLRGGLRAMRRRLVSRMSAHSTRAALRTGRAARVRVREARQRQGARRDRVACAGCSHQVRGLLGDLPTSDGLGDFGDDEPIAARQMEPPLSESRQTELIQSGVKSKKKKPRKLAPLRSRCSCAHSNLGRSPTGSGSQP